MVMIELSEKIAARLNRLAEERQQSLDETLESILNDLPTAEAPPAEAEDVYDENNPRPGTGAALLKAIRDANIHGGPSDVAERSREILNKEFPAYLLRRMYEDNEDNASEK